MQLSDTEISDFKVWIHFRSHSLYPYIYHTLTFIIPLYSLYPYASQRFSFLREEIGDYKIINVFMSSLSSHDTAVHQTMQVLRCHIIWSLRVPVRLQTVQSGPQDQALTSHTFVLLSYCCCCSSFLGKSELLQNVVLICLGGEIKLQVKMQQ